MGIDLRAAVDFVTTHGRILDRRRLDVILGSGDPAGVLAALDAYRNPDGGYGWGLELDLRSPESQPGAALHAFEVLAEAGPVTTSRAVELCEWLNSVALADGGLPFALPLDDPCGSAPWWVDADSTMSSLQVTAIVAANAHRAARHHPAVARHPWLAAASRYCADEIRNLGAAPHALELLFAVQLLDAAGETIDDSSELLERIGRHLPRDGVVHVEGGTEDETVRPLDFAPDPLGRARRLFSAGVIAAESQRLAGQQQPDGGWPYEPRAFSPASALEWRGYVTVRAVWILQRNGMLE